MFGSLGHNNLSAGCTVRYHITIVFIQIQFSYIAERTKMHTSCHSQLRAFLHLITWSRRTHRHICKKYNYTTDISLIWSCSCVDSLNLTVSMRILLVMITVKYGKDVHRRHVSLTRQYIRAASYLVTAAIAQHQESSG